MAEEGEIESALNAWRELVGMDNVLVGEALSARYGQSTDGLKREILAALHPLNVESVAEIVRVAARFKLPLYPVSTGSNWGYGSANPVVDGCALLDLSGLTAIDASAIDLGVVTVEPGVTQGMLRAYLDAHDLPFLVPVHGGGPSCSLMGNALERGYGITPYTDHFAAMTALEAVLPNGETYRSALADLGGAEVNGLFKWGIGPYLDGLFAQGNFGIVTRMTIALAPLPERVETFFFGVRDPAHLEQAVIAVREVLRAVGGIAGSVNLMNSRRVLSMMEPYPAHLVGPLGIVPHRAVAEMAGKAQVMAWTGIGALYGTKKVVKAARGAIRARLKGVASRLVFLSPQGVSRGRRVLERIPGKGGRRLWNYVSTLERSLQLIAGAPSQIALPLAYWKSGTKPRDGELLNPARDGCGLIWYPPLVPMRPEKVREFVTMAEEVCIQHRIEPLITLTSLSDRCFDSTVPILFDRSNPEETARAHACYEELLRRGQAIGCVPYRAGIHAMTRFTSADSPHWRLVRQLKTAVDPDELISPGRYCPPR